MYANILTFLVSPLFASTQVFCCILIYLIRLVSTASGYIHRVISPYVPSIPWANGPHGGSVGPGYGSY